MIIEWFTEDQTFLPSYDLAPHPPPPHPLSRQKLSLFLSHPVSYVAGRAYWRERSPIIRLRNSLVLCKSFNALRVAACILLLLFKTDEANDMENKQFKCTIQKLGVNFLNLISCFSKYDSLGIPYLLSVCKTKRYYLLLGKTTYVVFPILTQTVTINMCLKIGLKNYGFNYFLTVDSKSHIVKCSCLRSIKVFSFCLRRCLTQPWHWVAPGVWSLRMSLKNKCILCNWTFLKTNSIKYETIKYIIFKSFIQHYLKFDWNNARRRHKNSKNIPCCTTYSTFRRNH